MRGWEGGGGGGVERRLPNKSWVNMFPAWQCTMGPWDAEDLVDVRTARCDARTIRLGSDRIL